MFKRLRDNLFGRTDQSEAQQESAVESNDVDSNQSVPQDGEDSAAQTHPPEVPADQAILEHPDAETHIGAAPGTASEPAPTAAPAPAPGPETPAIVSLPAARPATHGALPPIVEPEEEVATSPAVVHADGTSEDEVDEADEVDEVVETAGPARSRGLFKNPFRFSLGRTRQLFGRVNQVLAADDITDDLWDTLEETLISSDVGVTTSERLMATLRERAQVENMTRGSQLRDALKEELELLLGEPEPLVFSDTSPLTAFLVVGVNGVGKTTSIAKLAHVLKRGRHRVLLAAGDTFRAAATEQIKLWGERIGVPVVSHQHGADPAAVVFDAVEAARARNCDVLIVDTAGRLHTKFNLMEELKKISRVLQKYDSEAPHEVLLVIDATIGQNGYLQAKQFIADAGVSGVILTKLDGTARGGIVFAIASELGLPIKYIGTGEKIGDLAEFEPSTFVSALFEED